MFTLERSQLTIRNNLTHTQYVLGQSRVTGIKQQPCVKVRGPRHASTREGSDGSVWPEEGWGNVASAQFWLPVSAAGESSGTPSSGAGGEGRALGT